MEIKARAKINIGLDVIGKRADGYHEVRMIMQSLMLHDTLVMNRISNPKIVITSDKREVPTDHRNLIYKACELLRLEFGIEEGVSIELKKVIPIAAGLAGGSTDAAAALKGMNELFSLGLSLEELKQRGARIGADVPYTLMGGTALAEGIGERLTKLSDMPDCFCLLAKPELSVSTKWVYESLKLDDLTVHPDIPGMLQCIKDRNLSGICSRMSNVLENVTIKRYPIIEEIKELMKKNGAENALMSGSGPTVFGLFTMKSKGEKAFEVIKDSGLAKDIFLTRLQNV